MRFDFTEFFIQYEAIAQSADLAFARVEKGNPGRVKCKLGCADCCHALFDLTLIEALYVNSKFHERFQGEEKEALLERANRADRQVYRVKREAHRALRAGQEEERILTEVAQKRVRCSLLNDQDRCDMYGSRPITCRLYGIPTAIAGTGHTCGISGFVEGRKYPTANLDIIQKQFYDLSVGLVRAMGSKHVRMAEMLVPLSMAILTEYDDEYLGIGREDESDG